MSIAKRKVIASELSWLCSCDISCERQKEINYGQKIADIAWLFTLLRSFFSICIIDRYPNSILYGIILLIRLSATPHVCSARVFAVSLLSLHAPDLPKSSQFSVAIFQHKSHANAVNEEKCVTVTKYIATYSATVLVTRYICENISFCKQLNK